MGAAPLRSPFLPNPEHSREAKERRLRGLGHSAEPAMGQREWHGPGMFVCVLFCG